MNNILQTVNNKEKLDKEIQKNISSLDEYSNDATNYIKEFNKVSNEKYQVIDDKKNNLK